MPTVTDQAICIRQWDWSETSQTVWMFGRELGLVRGVAKGSKREKSRFSGGIEPLTRGEMIAILKPGAELATMIAWDLQETFPALRRSLSSFYSGMYMADLVQHSLTERDPHPALFDALLESLRRLGDPAADRSAVLAFQWATLVETGYRPEIETDILTGRPLSGGAMYIFFPAMGGFTSHPLETGSRTTGPQWRVRGGTVELLQSLARGMDGDPAAAADPEALDRASRLLSFYLREVLGRDLPSRGVLFGERTS